MTKAKLSGIGSRILIVVTSGLPMLFIISATSICCTRSIQVILGSSTRHIIPSIKAINTSNQDLLTIERQSSILGSNWQHQIGEGVSLEAYLKSFGNISEALRSLRIHSQTPRKKEIINALFNLYTRRA